MKRSKRPDEKTPRERFVAGLFRLIEGSPLAVPDMVAVLEITKISLVVSNMDRLGESLKKLEEKTL